VKEATLRETIEAVLVTEIYGAHPRVTEALMVALLPKLTGTGDIEDPYWAHELNACGAGVLKTWTEAAYRTVERDLEKCKVAIIHTACPDPDGNPYCVFPEDGDLEGEGKTLLEAVENLRTKAKSA
jgi:hypothetical protein